MRPMLYPDLSHVITSFYRIPLEVFLKTNELTFVKYHETFRLKKPISNINSVPLTILNVPRKQMENNQYTIHCSPLGVRAALLTC